MSERSEHPEVFEKYAKIDISGRKSLDNKDIKEFKEDPEGWKNGFSVVLLPDEESTRVINDRIISKIEKMEKELGIQFSLSGRDSRLHSTVLGGQFEGSGDDRDSARNRAFTTLKEQISQSGLAETLKGQEIEFKYVLLDKGNILLTAVDIPEAVSRAREELATAYSANGVKHISYENILHMSVARISGLPEDPEKLKEYKKRMIELRHEISSGPLMMRVKDIYSGDALEVLKSDVK